MRELIYVLTAIVVLGIVSCSKSMSRYDEEIDRAQQTMRSNTDSALSILDAIDPFELKIDSLRAKYHFLKGYGHLKRNRSMIGDSLISYAHEYYRGKDVVRDIRSGMVFAWYKFWVGDTPGALAMLDSLAELPDVPDSLMLQVLRVRVLLGASEYQGKELIPYAKKFHELETDSMRKTEARYMLLSAYEYAGETDSALYLVDELIDYARDNRWGDKQFLFELERAQLLTENSRSGESDELIGEIFRKAGPGNGAADLLYFQYAINALNSGDVGRAARNLALADSVAGKLRKDDDAYYRSYSNLLHAIIDFKQTGRIKLMHINGLNNRQNERFNRVKASQWESERGALRQQNRALALKAESEHKTVIILIISLVTLVVMVGAIWIIRIRRLRERENEERIEALQKMVDEYKATPAVPDSEIKGSAALRSAMLKQLGIIKMVAETPTEQNREMLRKISSIDGEINGELVDWSNVFEMIDNLYSGFYATLHHKYGDVLSLKEEQIIVLMVAGFSTKEISVITGQTTSTVYVRKSSIRKKLGVPEKEDIVRFLLSQRRS
ncbi:MAG TPA: helix-turn-helix transcriptional regulator [Muribaculum sp.]|uniref:helix-turn-helix domain-containing protein n=1 Tax=Heminiphilus faecis TaxID=2601703 RepID=UPI000EF595EB|nr:helix-turn-helix transcriptional regulator [Heminiphilus faecis]RLT76386.1 LuxR family transcriptional regulator [bacterium J10(2018)]HRF68772.1 helix-turn-helix transcriptional regulator [Muribaculum sp.]